MIEIQNQLTMQFKENNRNEKTRQTTQLKYCILEYFVSECGRLFGLRGEWEVMK